MRNKYRVCTGRRQMFWNFGTSYQYFVLVHKPWWNFRTSYQYIVLVYKPGRIRFYCTGSGGPHWKVPVHIGGSLYFGQSNVMTFSLSPVLNWRYNSKQGDRDFVSTIKLGYRENVSSSVWLTFRCPSLVTFRFPSLVNQSNVSKNNVNQSVSLFEKSAKKWKKRRRLGIHPTCQINIKLGILNCFF